MNPAEEIFRSLYPKEWIWMEHQEPVAPPKKELSSFVKTLLATPFEQLYVYGLGEGELFFALEPYLTKEQEIIFLEPHLGVLAHFLQTPGAEKVLERCQVYPFGEKEASSILQQLSWQGYRKRCVCVKDPRYLQNEFKLIEEELLYEQNKLALFADEFFHGAVLFYRNFFQNSKKMAESFLAEAWSGQYRKVPALLVGAGPSLEKNVQELSRLKEQALIMTGGSGLNALLHQGIQPHLTVGVDPNQAQKVRVTSTKIPCDLPFVYRLRYNTEALESLSCPKVYLSGGGVFSVVSWLERALGLELSNVEEGYSVITLLVELALQMGCDPIVFVGLDLAYTEGLPYAKGVADDALIAKDLVETKDLFGEKTWTKWMWIKEAKWIEEKVEATPSTTFLNATEGGLGLGGVENVVLETLLWKRQTNQKLPLVSLGVTQEDVEQALSTLFASYKRCLSLFAEAQTLAEVTLQEKTHLEEFETLESFFLEEKLKEEVAYKESLALFHTIFTTWMTAQPVFYRIRFQGLTEAAKKEVLALYKEKMTLLSKVATLHMKLYETSGLSTHLKKDAL